MGRVYTVLFQFESLVQQWPMQMFFKNSITTYTNYLRPVDNGFEKRVLGNMRAQEVVKEVVEKLR